MKFLEHFLESKKPLFEKGGKLEKFYPLYEALDTFVYTPDSVTKTTAHVRDGLDLKRTMFTVVIALIPCILMALYNTGYQAHLVLETGKYVATGWRHDIFTSLGLVHDPASVVANMVYGLLFLLPIFLVCNITGGIVEVVFASIRKHEVNEGFLVTGWLIPLIVPPTMPLWQIAIGTAFGVIFGKEVFGGTGKNIFNPALMARAFLFFAYPAQISGDQPWVAVDGFSGATALSQVASGGIENLKISWMDAFLGLQAGSMGETSELACLIGAVILIGTGIGSWRIMLACLIGFIGMTSIFNAIGSTTNPMFNVPVAWQLVLGSFAFGAVFMATDPVSASMTNTGKWIYGILIGMLGVLIRVANPAYPEGWMLAILFMNAFSPTIDFFVMKANIKRRMARNV
ncbi:NADH:ubiquinone reductase (Na(+)-transporting) subunit B [Peredibacter starrii]|uniref:Na(+)-translocating NADH-quinone reductase subunit B n=1 Tax=Peredibacter starrii TaxID=28202 RepID=A0AAX4HS45_9BACT|nr:NADH:ubiquinone reductase (Na(+)-transporting) subunit B [Peredibacter starrii]WPU66154.1 NADH:ubiquinone reductase (Na(+)-transporting) subunit B [Peredibacter starrii]